MALTYDRYLKLDELLALQQPLSEGPEHDEMLFIVLEAASGFQSQQFRELEIALGYRVAGMPAHYDAERAERLRARMRERSLYASFLRFLAARGYPIPEAALRRDPQLPPLEHEDIRRVLVDVYRRDPSTRDVCERLVDLDEGIQEWRYRLWTIRTEL